MSGVSSEECQGQSSGGLLLGVAAGWVGWWAQQAGMLREAVVQGVWRLQLGQAALDDNVAQHVLVDAHLHVDLAEGLRTQGEIQLPDVGLCGRAAVEQRWQQ